MDYQTLQDNVSAYTTKTDVGSAPMARIVHNAELRIVRDLDPLEHRRTDVAQVMTPGGDTIDISTITDNVYIRSIRWRDEYGEYHFLEPRNEDFIRQFWPDPRVRIWPSVYAVKDTRTLFVAPTPRLAYAMEVVYTSRPTSIVDVPDGTETWISRWVPDCLFFATMVEYHGYMKNYGAANVSDPQGPPSWDQRYQTALAKAQEEENLRRFQSAHN